MKQKHSRLCLAILLCLPLAAAAQNVTVYGLIDLAVERVSDTAPNGAALVRMPSLTGSVPSRLGFRGSEDLGGGLQLVFTLEQGLGADTGGLNQGGRAFGRQSFVGLSGRWGTLSFGRQYTMLYWALLDADVIGPSAYSMASLDSYFPNARADNALAWRGRWGGWQLGATWSPGRDAVNAGPSPAGTNCAGEGSATTDRRACRQHSLLLKFDSDGWGLALARDRFSGGPGAFAGLTASNLKDTRDSANGYVKLGRAKVGAGHVQRRNQGHPTRPDSGLSYLGVQFAATPQVVLEAQWLQLRFSGSADRARLAVVRASLALSKRSTVYATAGAIANDGGLALSVSGAQPGGAPVAGGSQNGLAAGLRHVF